MTTTPITTTQPEADRVGTLSPRQLQIVEGVWAETPCKTIAVALGIAPSTLKSHLLRIKVKLHVQTLAGISRQFERWRLCFQCPPKGGHQRADRRKPRRSTRV